MYFMYFMYLYRNMTVTQQYIGIQPREGEGLSACIVFVLPL